MGNICIYESNKHGKLTTAKKEFIEFCGKEKHELWIIECIDLSQYKISQIRKHATVKSTENSTSWVVILKRCVAEWFSEANLTSFATNMHHIRTRTSLNLDCPTTYTTTHVALSSTDFYRLFHASNFPTWCFYLLLKINAFNISEYSFLHVRRYECNGLQV